MSRPSLLGVRLLNYLTNDVVGHIPSFRLRHAWYRRLGIRLDPGAGVHRNCYVWFYGPGSLRRNGVRIGANSRINRGVCLDGRGPLVIGENVSISADVAILTTQHAWASPGFPLESRPVVIEDHVWIGMRATILPGAVLRRGAVVAAGAVVSGEVPALTVVAGVPARPVAQRPDDAARYVLEDALPWLE